MPHIFDLPMELLSLTLGHLELADVVHFCLTCRSMRQAFKPQYLIWVVENYNSPSSDLARALPIGKKIESLSYLLRCHAFLELFRRFGVHQNYTLLLERGASFRPITHGLVLENYWDAFGPGETIEFLLRHGFSFSAVAGGPDRLLEDALRHQNHKSASFLIRHGASMQALPSGPEQVLEDLFKKVWGWNDVPWTHVMFILKETRPLLRIPRGFERWLARHFTLDRLDALVAYLPNGINVMLKIALCRYGLGIEVDEILMRGASFHEIPRTGDVQYDASGIVSAIHTDNFEHIDSKGQTPLIRAVILGHVDAVTFLLDNGADYEAEWKNGSPLSHATTRDKLEVARLLLERGASISGKMTPCDYSHQATPLLCDAVQRSYCEIALLLLTHAADPDVMTNDGSTPMHLAAERDRWEAIRMLLDHGACSRIADANGYYPLTLAAANGCFAAVKALATDCEVNMPDEGGRTALIAAAASRRLDIVQLLLDRGADPTLSGSDGRTPLFAASSVGHIGIVDLFIQLGADINASYNGWTPLYAAARKGHLSTVQRLLSKGAIVSTEGPAPVNAAVQNLHLAVVRNLVGPSTDLESCDEKGQTPLLIAASVDFLAGIRLLMQKGANTSAINEEGESALHIAVNHGYIHTGMVICKYIAVDQPNKKGRTPIHLAASLGSLDLVRAFVEYGRNIESTAEEGESCANPRTSEADQKKTSPVTSIIASRDQYGCTPLSAAAEKGHVHVVRYLVSKGADANTKDSCGRTPLFDAVMGKHIEVAEFLLGKGADVNAPDPSGRVALHFAGLHEDPALVSLLIDHGAKEVHCSEGTPLHFAAGAGSIDTAALLIERGADLSATTRAGDTPLHLAIEHPAIVQQLLSHGAEVDARNTHGQTPLMNAVQLSAPASVQYLADAGADPNQEMDGTTPFHWVSRFGLLDAATSMRRHGASVHLCDSVGRTPLHHAAAQGWLDVATFLVGQGADPFARDVNDRMPWNHAFDNNHREVAWSLLSDPATTQYLLEEEPVSAMGSKWPDPATTQYLLQEDAVHVGIMGSKWPPVGVLFPGWVESVPAVSEEWKVQAVRRRGSCTRPAPRQA